MRQTGLAKQSCQMMCRIKTRLSLPTPFGVLLFADAGSTLYFQPTAYWNDHSLLREGNPFFARKTRRSSSNSSRRCRMPSINWKRASSHAWGIRPGSEGKSTDLGERSGRGYPFSPRAISSTTRTALRSGYLASKASNGRGAREKFWAKPSR